ncbi:hypothetical protein FKP32DRAFT_1753764, partial [Trametes sanguinea]
MVFIVSIPYSIKKRPASTAVKRKAPPEAASPARKRTKTDDARTTSRKPRSSAISGNVTIRPAALVTSSSSSDSDSDSTDDSSSETDSDSDSD